MTNEEILELEFESSDLGKEVAIKDFFKELLVTLFQERVLQRQKTFWK